MSQSVYARRERIPVRVMEHDEIATEVAGRIASLIRARADEGRDAVLGLATGSTPVGVYRELIRLHREEGLDFANVVTFNLDEYFPMRPGSIHSYHRYMRENLFDRVNIRPGRCHIPRGDLAEDEVEAHCADFERRIREAGGIDLLLLGIGRSGHIGFNEPGSVRDSRTRRLYLDTVTRADAAGDFFGEENVPPQADHDGGGRRSWRRARSCCWRPASTRRKSCCARWRGRCTPTWPRPSCSSTGRRRCTSTRPRPRISPASAPRGWSAMWSGRPASRSKP